MNTQTLKNILTRFKNKRVLVIGDLILDHYVFGSVDRVSPEAPVPVVWANRENFVCGGAANVGLNLVSLGAEVTLAGVTGDDHFGSVLMELIKKKSIHTNLIMPITGRPTTLKTRIIGNHQQVVRLDWESVNELSLAVNQVLLKKITHNLSKYDAVIIEDYGKGVVNPQLLETVIRVCRKQSCIVTVDPKEEHFEYYAGVTSLTPNLKEAQNMAGMKIKAKSEIPLLGEMIMEKLKPASLLLTLGEDGMMIFHDGKRRHIPTFAQEVFDVTGAGDTVIASFTLALACKASFFDAATIANCAAGIVVGKLGAATTTPKELQAHIAAMPLAGSL